jgi:hypothetical protein
VANWCWVIVAAVVALVFGVVTIVVGGRTLFGDPAERAAAGAIVPFVLWFNFAAGFAYVAAGIGLFLSRRWAAHLSAVIAAATVAVFAAFAIHILLGGAFEARTVGAMTIRSLVWIAIAITACRAFGCAWRGSGDPA